MTLAACTRDIALNAPVVLDRSAVFEAPLRSRFKPRSKNYVAGVGKGTKSSKRDETPHNFMYLLLSPPL